MEVFIDSVLENAMIEAQPISVSILKAVDLVDSDPAVQLRIDKLRKWRKEKAQGERVAAYRILSNRTLLEISRANLRVSEDLLKIRGIGVKKMATLGDEILALIGNVSE